MCSLSYVHVYRIEYVSYRQGPYRICIVSAADRIVPALVSWLAYLTLTCGHLLQCMCKMKLIMCHNFTAAALSLCALREFYV